MSAKKVGQVSAEQRDEIQRLFERKNALAELFPIIKPENQSLYEKAVADMGETDSKFQHWWDERAEEYQWERTEHGQWEIDFNTGEIFLVEKM
ncbi:MAG: CXXX repeat peptide modification system protein [Planctomycetaceae bacterium]|jgi:CXXX repeat modification system protein|nr:CXXX repeat peptide modification system protein [Planctomycetaceae bacterium]